MSGIASVGSEVITLTTAVGLTAWWLFKKKNYLNFRIVFDVQENCEDNSEFPYHPLPTSSLYYSQIRFLTRKGQMVANYV